MAAYHTKSEEPNLSNTNRNLLYYIAGVENNQVLYDITIQTYFGGSEAASLFLEGLVAGSHQAAFEETSVKLANFISPLQYKRAFYVGSGARKNDLVFEQALAKRDREAATWFLIGAYRNSPSYGTLLYNRFRLIYPERPAVPSRPLRLPGTVRAIKLEESNSISNLEYGIKVARAAAGVYFTDDIDLLEGAYKFAITYGMPYNPPVAEWAIKYGDINRIRLAGLQMLVEEALTLALINDQKPVVDFITQDMGFVISHNEIIDNLIFLIKQSVPNYYSINFLISIMVGNGITKLDFSDLLQYSSNTNFRLAKTLLGQVI